MNVDDYVFLFYFIFPHTKISSLFFGRGLWEGKREFCLFNLFAEGEKTSLI